MELDSLSEIQRKKKHKKKKKKRKVPLGWAGKGPLEEASETASEIRSTRAHLQQLQSAGTCEGQ